jgi:hypothetical protein
LTEIDKQVAVTQQLIEDHITTARRLEDELKSLRSQQTLRCAKCDATDMIQDLVYVQVEYYKKPYSCTGGDYWYDSDKSEYICPHCGTHNMLQFDGYYDLPYEERGKYENSPEKQFQRQYKRLFKEVQEVSDKSRRGYWGGIEYSWVHNDWVDQHREAFNLSVGYKK